MSEYHFHTLSNGIRIAHKENPHSKVSHCGFVFDIGSRDEKDDRQGIAHFWEHMAFKGTEKRKAYHILNRLDAVGGELNAYTTKENISFYASLLTAHFEKAVDLLADIAFRSIFPEKEIEKERSVILEEMSMYADDPASAIQDDFDEVVFGNHPLGKNILGTTESVGRFRRDDFLEFIGENIDTSSVIFSSVSSLPFAKVLKMAEKYFSDIPATHSPGNRRPFAVYSARKKTVKKPISQAHCMIGCPAYELDHELRPTFFLLNNLLGGPGMNSRLNLSLREKHGLVYSVETNYSTYRDTGLFSVYFGTEKSTLEKCKSLIYKELKILRESKIGDLKLHRAKQQLIGQMAMGEENKLSEMLMMGKSLLDLGRIQSADEAFKKIEEITAEQFLEASRQIFETAQMSELTFLPTGE